VLEFVIGILWIFVNVADEVKLRQLPAVRIIEELEKAQGQVIRTDRWDLFFGKMEARKAPGR
jgi:hypothetical protein